MNQNKGKVAAYIRVSTVEQAGEDRYSLKSQLEAIQKQCDMEGLTIVDTYADRGISGTSMDKRLELQRLLEDAKTGKFDKVFVLRISRMARNTKDLLQIVDELQNYNVSFKSISENFEVETSSGKMIAQILASFSEYEANVIRDNTSEGLLQRAHAGLYSGPIPLGFDKTEQASEPMSINSYEASIVQQIYDMYEKSNGFRAIANTLNKGGHQTKRGNPFSIAAIKDILTNPLYKGYVRYRNHIDWNKKRRRGKNPNPIIVKGQHEAIITEDQWERVNLRLKQRSKTPKVLGDGSNILTGVLRCPECDGAMAASNTTNRLKNGEKKRIRYYSCARFRSQGATACHANSVRADDIEAMVADNMMTLIDQPDILKTVIETANERLSQQHERQTLHQPRLENEIEELALKIHNLSEMVQVDDSLSSILGDKINEYQTQLEEKKIKLQQGERAKKKVISLKYGENEMQWVLEKIQEAFDKGNKMAIKQLYLSIIQKITFKKTKPRKIDSFTIYLKPDIGSTLLDGLNTDEASTGASSFSMPETGIILHYPKI